MDIIKMLQEVHLNNDRFVQRISVGVHKLLYRMFKFYYIDIFNSHERPLELFMPVENTNYN